MARRGTRIFGERVRQAAWSALVALVLWFFAFVAPIDEFIWSLQARVADFRASGDIVFVGSEEDFAHPTRPGRRDELARAVDNLRQAGVDAVYLDLALDDAPVEPGDAELNRALRSFDGQAFLVRRLVTSIGRGDTRQAHSVIAEGVPQVGGERWYSVFGYVWDMPYVSVQDGQVVPSAPAALANVTGNQSEPFPINYGFAAETIPTYRFSQFAGAPIPAELATRLRGKQVVIGSTAPDDAFAIPGHLDVPGSMIYIFAAETLKSGYVGSVFGITVLLAALAGLVGATMVNARRTRYLIYGAVVVALPLAAVLTALQGIRISESGALTLLICFLGFRLRSRWKSDLLLVDQETGLPTFAALESDTAIAQDAPGIIVAKLHRFEDVRKTLPAELHVEYVTRIVDRMNAADPDTRIYLGPGHLIAWCMSERDPVLVKEHLEGLRALFASPLHVGDQQVDVGITFGLDLSTRADVTRRLANAVSAAERTNETYEPIVLGEIDNDEELIWNISFQARVDRALENGEIYLNYQPKVLIESGEIIGLEALLRWRDPVRGMIRPDHFIRHCENTGRMSHVTRHVLLEACRAGVSLFGTGKRLSVAVNISATMLHEQAIVTMVRDVLEETGFDPALLTLEITETYRILDLDIAASILRELATLGLRVSMDDFGVGAASLEALMSLPFTELKVDRVFVDRITKDPKALGIVRSVLMLGEQLRIVVVAEGVEDNATLGLLGESGCPVAQGFGLYRPDSLDAIVQILDRSEKPNAKLIV